MLKKVDPDFTGKSYCIKWEMNNSISMKVGTVPRLFTHL